MGHLRMKTIDVAIFSFNLRHVTKFERNNKEHNTTLRNCCPPCVRGGRQHVSPRQPRIPGTPGTPGAPTKC